MKQDTVNFQNNISSWKSDRIELHILQNHFFQIVSILDKTTNRLDIITEVNPATSAELINDLMDGKYEAVTLISDNRVPYVSTTGQHINRSTFWTAFS